MGRSTWTETLHSVGAMWGLWSLRADTLHQYFLKNEAVEPIVVKLSVHEREGEGEGEGEGRMLAEATNERFLIGDGVSRLPIKEGNVQGVLFTPPGRWYASKVHHLLYHVNT